MTDFLTSIRYNDWILPALLVLPVLGAIGISVHGMLAPRRVTADGVAIASPTPKWMALFFFVALFVVSLGLWWTYEPARPLEPWVRLPWIPAWGASFTLGIDGIALMMILLTTFLMPLTVLGSWSGIRSRTHAYYALLLILTTGMLGVFVALDLLLFYVMWEVMLVPMYFIIGMWGGERRIYASLKFFIYTMIGSLLMLVAIIFLWTSAARVTGQASFDYVHIVTSARFGAAAAMWLFGAFFLAFAIKVPMFPFHTWLPDAHVEAPTAGSVILAGIMLKMGTYGFIRFAMPFFPAVAMHPTIKGLILLLAVVGIIYGALVAMVQPDFKKLVAYSSVSHLGFVMLGLFALTLQSVQGALMVMINHGISTGALFFLIGMMYERKHSRMIEDYGGIARVVPMFAALLTLVALSSIGLPGTNGFVGEFLVLIGAFRTEPILTTIATTGVIFAAAYLLWALQRMLFNRLDKPANEHLRDLNPRELLLMAPLVAAIIWLGVHPGPVLRRMEPSARNFIQIVEQRAGAALVQRSGEAP
ncbi:MAG TPA: NADH-quinone oxidoreductase subunit M [Gemmatimonadaceae bacterium]|nr:NADH-quinone oxidoreductase subunit M [Gemmatimonadaceae bacterium]